MTKEPEEENITFVVQFGGFANAENGTSANRVLCLTQEAERPVLVRQPFKDRDCEWTYLVPVSPGD